MNAQQPCLVKVEFERVQSYLFAVPELKAMIGANARVGEILRGRLVNGGFAAGKPISLPRLACDGGAALPQGVDPDKLSLAAPDPKDPLTSPRDSDDPASAFRRGILARDGGHLHAVFPDPGKASDFIRQARQTVGRELPGLLLAARLIPLELGQKGWKEGEEGTAAADGGEALMDLPQFQVCQVTGQGPASRRDLRTPAGEPARWIADAVRARRLAARLFDRGKSGDILGLLRGRLVRELGLEQCDEEALFPSEFEDVATSGYLAVVAADGNGVGKRSKKWREEGNALDYFAREAHGEKFFHAMRVAVRKSLVAALKDTFRVPVERIQTAGVGRLPFRLMMLGGDDLLLVCDAAYAMPFCVAYADQLNRTPLKLTQQDGSDIPPIDVGIGVAVVKKKFPFHRSHALAEQLAASAKRSYRERPSCGSTIDWLAISEAWHEDVAEVRRRDARRSYSVDGAGPETLILSRKPYPVLGNDRSLKKLLEGAGAAVGKLARGQLMALADGLGRGKRQADWAIRLLGDDARTALQAALNNKSAWHDVGSGRWATSVLDFLELFELKRLRQRQERELEASGE